MLAFEQYSSIAICKRFRVRGAKHRRVFLCSDWSPPARRCWMCHARSCQLHQQCHLVSLYRTLAKPPKSVEDLPTWNYDGSSTGQAPGDDSEVYLVPRAIYKDPFRGGDAILVMCDAYEPPKVKEDGSVAEPVAIPTNTRAACAEVMKKVEAEVRATSARGAVTSAFAVGAC